MATPPAVLCGVLADCRLSFTLSFRSLLYARFRLDFACHCDLLSTYFAAVAGCHFDCHALLRILVVPRPRPRPRPRPHPRPRRLPVCECVCPCQAGSLSRP